MQPLQNMVLHSVKVPPILRHQNFFLKILSLKFITLEQKRFCILILRIYITQRTFAPFHLITFPLRVRYVTSTIWCTVCHLYNVVFDMSPVHSGVRYVTCTMWCTVCHLYNVVYSMSPVHCVAVIDIFKS